MSTPENSMSEENENTSSESDTEITQSEQNELESEKAQTVPDLNEAEQSERPSEESHEANSDPVPESDQSKVGSNETDPDQVKQETDTEGEVAENASDEPSTESDEADSTETSAPEGLKKILEAAILVADEPLSVEQLISLFHEDEGEVLDKQTIRNALEEITEDYADRGIELKQVASGYRFQARKTVAKWVNRLWTERPPRYTRALLETLALIAYRQPITRGEIESVRGVSVSSNVLKTMLEREWIKVAGHRDVPGRPAVYVTTKYFLDYFNLKSLSELPSLAELRDLDDIAQDLFMNGNPTDKAAEDSEKEEDAATPDQIQGEQITDEELEKFDETADVVEEKTEQIEMNGSEQEEGDVGEDRE